jgi:hypothetical protein
MLLWGLQSCKHWHQKAVNFIPEDTPRMNEVLLALHILYLAMSAMSHTSSIHHDCSTSTELKSDCDITLSGDLACQLEKVPML